MSESRSLLITTFRNNFRVQLHIKRTLSFPKGHGNMVLVTTWAGIK